MVPRSLMVPALSSLVLVSACGYDALGPSYRGDYDLQSVNGQSVPATVYESSTSSSSFSVEVTFGALHLHGDNTFSLDFDLSQWDNGAVTRSTHGFSGTYDLSGGDLYLYFIDPNTNRDRTLSGFVRDRYAEVTIDGVIDGQLLRYAFSR